MPFCDFVSRSRSFVAAACALGMLVGLMCLLPAPAVAHSAGGEGDCASAGAAAASAPAGASSLHAQADASGKPADYNGEWETIKLPAGSSYKTIQNALDSARENATDDLRWKIVLEPGEYRLIHGLHIYSNTWLYATGAYITWSDDALAESNMIGNMIKVGTLGKDPMSGYGYKNIVVEGGDWDAAGTDGTMIKACHVSGFTLKDATVRNCLNSHMSEIAGAEHVLIQDCTFATSKRDSTFTQATEMIQIDILQEEHINGYEHLDDEIDVMCRDFYIERCTFTDGDYGVGSHTAVNGRFFENINITNCTFSNISTRGIGARCFRNSTIAGNKVKTKGVALWVYNMHKEGAGAYASTSDPSLNKTVAVPKCNLVIADNTFTSTADQAVSLYGVRLTAKTKNAPAGSYWLNGVTFEGNKVSGKGQYPVSITFAKNSMIRNNTIIAKGQKAGIALSRGTASTVSIIGNTIKGNPISGIVTFTLDADKPLYGATKVKAISKNTIVKVRDAGIRVSATNVGKINGNIVKEAGGDGICVTSKSQVSSISNNVVKITGGHGIRLEASNAANVKVNANTIKGNASHFGIYIYSGKVTLAKNKVSACQVGVRSNEAAVVKLEKGNTFIACAQATFIR